MEYTHTHTYTLTYTNTKILTHTLIYRDSYGDYNAHHNKYLFPVMSAILKHIVIFTVAGINIRTQMLTSYFLTCQTKRN